MKENVVYYIVFSSNQYRVFRMWRKKKQCSFETSQDIGHPGTYL